MNVAPADMTLAIQDFRRARSQADLKEMLARLTGESTQLLSYDEVRQHLRVQGGIERGVQDIPLDAIVGSVGRYTDFTRDFLPRSEVNPERWARIKIATSGLVGLPPIDVYQIGQIYFVKDGNHRVSVARQFGATYIQAYVTEVHSRVPLTPDMQLDDLILKAEYVEFLERTHLDELRPKANLNVTIPGQYAILLEHIEAHRYYMGLDLKRDISYPESVTHWYDTIYQPVMEIIRQQGILHKFPERTEVDLYLWIAEHRAAIEKDLGWEIRTEYAVKDLAEQFSSSAGKTLSRWGSRILRLILPDKLESGPPVGEWRARTQNARPGNRLFTEILVPVNGQESGWCALEQALVVAEREGARLHGLHIVPGEQDQKGQPALAIQAQFDERCKEANIDGRLVIASGEVSQQICTYAHWADLVVTNLSYPPPAQPLARLSSGFRDLVARCSCPILATPQTRTELSRALLAFDGGPKAQEALYVAAYLAGQWCIQLVVACVRSGDSLNQSVIDQAKAYLDQYKIEASFVQPQGMVGSAILEASENHDCDLLIMGGYGLNPVLEVVLGSAVDDVLRSSCKPMLICR